MANATVAFLNRDKMIEYYGTSAQSQLAKKHLKDSGNYADTRPISIDLEGLHGEDAAEELFDLTNNPSRYEECVARCGKTRSLSVGDIVYVDHLTFVCCSFGWKEI